MSITLSCATLTSAEPTEPGGINWGELTEEEIFEISKKLVEMKNELYVEDATKGFKAYYIDKDMEQAKKHWSNARLLQDNGLTNYQLGSIYLIEGNFKQALDYFEVAVKDKDYFFKYYPQFIPITYARLGYTYWFLDRLEETQAPLEKALELGYNDDPLLFHVLSIAYYNKGMMDKTLEMLERGVAVDPNYEPLVVNLGDTYKELGQKEKAIIYLTRFLAITERPDDDPVVQAVKKDLEELKK